MLKISLHFHSYSNYFILKLHICIDSKCNADSIYLKKNTETWFCKNCVQSIFPFNHLDDDLEFLNVLSDNNSHERVPLPDILNESNKLFIPFELNDNENLQIDEIDPDLQFY